MAKVRVLSRFRDKMNSEKVFNAGDIVCFEDADRVRDIVERGLGEVVEEPSEQSVEEEQPKPKTPRKRKK